MSPVLIITSATMLVIGALYYFRVVANRAGFREEKEHWMVFGVFAGLIAASGVSKDNVWVSLIGLLLAVAGIIYHARLVLADAGERNAHNS